MIAVYERHIFSMLPNLAVYGDLQGVFLPFCIDKRGIAVYNINVIPYV